MKLRRPSLPFQEDNRKQHPGRLAVFPPEFPSPSPRAVSYFAAANPFGKVNRFLWDDCTIARIFPPRLVRSGLVLNSHSFTLTPPSEAQFFLSLWMRAGLDRVERVLSVFFGLPVKVVRVTILSQLTLGAPPPRPVGFGVLSVAFLCFSFLVPLSSSVVFFVITPCSTVAFASPHGSRFHRRRFRASSFPPPPVMTPTPPHALQLLFLFDARSGEKGPLRRSVRPSPRKLPSCPTRFPDARRGQKFGLGPPYSLFFGSAPRPPRFPQAFSRSFPSSRVFEVHVLGWPASNFMTPGSFLPLLPSFFASAFRHSPAAPVFCMPSFFPHVLCAGSVLRLCRFFFPARISLRCARLVFPWPGACFLFVPRLHNQEIFVVFGTVFIVRSTSAL